MKKSIPALLTFISLIIIFALVATTYAFADGEKSETVALAEELEWVSAISGHGEVQKNATWSGEPIVVNGKTYSENCIGSHIPAGDANADIVYDISKYSDKYEWFQVALAQPDDGNNMINGITPNIISVKVKVMLARRENEPMNIKTARNRFSGP